MGIVASAFKLKTALNTLIMIDYDHVNAINHLCNPVFSTYLIQSCFAHYLHVLSTLFVGVVVFYM